MIKLSDECADLVREYTGERFTLRQLMARLGTRGAAFFSLILSLPFIAWVAFPGLSIVFGLLMFMNGIQIARHKGIWIPKRWAKRTFSGDRFARGLVRARKWILFCEKGIKPRYHLLCTHSFFRVLTGGMIAVSALILALPLFPGTNFTPAVGIALLSIGQLEDDGLFTLIGYGVFLLNLVMFIFLPIFGIYYVARWI